MSNENYYETLGIQRNASQEDIKKAYRKKAIKYHPDTNSGDKEKEEKFKQISEAYNVLSDEQEKAYYDRTGSPKKNGKQYRRHQAVNLEDLFGAMPNFANFNSGRGIKFENGSFMNVGSQFNRPDNIITLQLSMANAIKGGKAKIHLQRLIACDECQGRGFSVCEKLCHYCNGEGHVRRGSRNISFTSPCTSCQGTGKKLEKCKSCGGKKHSTKEESIVIKIPAGLHPSTKLKIEDKGNEVYFGGKKVCGHTFVIVDYPTKENGVRIEMGDIYTAINVPFHLVLADAEIKVNILDIKEIKLKLSHRYKSGHQYRVESEGVVKSGNALIKVFIDIPEKDIGEDKRKELVNLTREIYGMHEGSFKPYNQG